MSRQRKNKAGKKQRSLRLDPLQPKILMHGDPIFPLSFSPLQSQPLQFNTPAQLNIPLTTPPAAAPPLTTLHSGTHITLGPNDDHEDDSLDCDPTEEIADAPRVTKAESDAFGRFTFWETKQDGTTTTYRNEFRGPGPSDALKKQTTKAVKPAGDSVETTWEFDANGNVSKETTVLTNPAGNTSTTTTTYKRNKQGDITEAHTQTTDNAGNVRRDSKTIVTMNADEILNVTTNTTTYKADGTKKAEVKREFKYNAAGELKQYDTVNGGRTSESDATSFPLPTPSETPPRKPFKHGSVKTALQDLEFTDDLFNQSNVVWISHDGEFDLDEDGDIDTDDLDLWLQEDEAFSGELIGDEPDNDEFADLVDELLLNEGELQAPVEEIDTDDAPQAPAPTTNTRWTLVDPSLEPTCGNDPRHRDPGYTFIPGQGWYKITFEDSTNSENNVAETESSSDEEWVLVDPSTEPTCGNDPRHRDPDYVFSPYAGWYRRVVTSPESRRQPDRGPDVGQPGPIAPASQDRWILVDPNQGPTCGNDPRHRDTDYTFVPGTGWMRRVPAATPQQPAGPDPTVGSPQRRPRVDDQGNPFVFTHPHPDGGSTVITHNDDGTITTARVDADGKVIDAKTTRPIQPGPSDQGTPAAGDADSGRTYGRTFTGSDGSGRTEILDADGKVIGYKFFGPEASGESDNSAPEADDQPDSDSDNETAWRPLPPVRTPLASGGEMTSTQNEDGTWTHRAYIETENGTLDFEIKRHHNLYPHADPRFWPPGGIPDQPLETELENGAVIRHIPNGDGNWSHWYCAESDQGPIEFEMEPTHEHYPHDDPRFAPKP